MLELKSEAQYQADLTEFWRRRDDEDLPLKRAIEQAPSGPRRVLALLDFVEHRSETYEQWIRWLENDYQKWREAGRVNEFKAMKLPSPSDGEWRAYAWLFSEMRRACNDRSIPSEALSAAIAGMGAVHAGDVALSDQEADGTRAQRWERATGKLCGRFTPGGMLSSVGLADMAVKLRAACEKEIVNADTKAPETKTPREMAGEGQLGKVKENILRAMAKSKTLQAVVDITAAAGGNEKTNGKALRAMEVSGHAHRPEGKNGGWGITAKGTAFLKTSR